MHQVISRAVTPRTAATASIEATEMTRPGAARNISRMSFMSVTPLDVGTRVGEVRPMTDHVCVVGDGDISGASHPEPAQVFGGGDARVVARRLVVDLGAAVAVFVVRILSARAGCIAGRCFPWMGAIVRVLGRDWVLQKW